MAHAHCKLGTSGYKHTLSEFVILIDFLLQHWLQERSSLLRHIYVACLFYSLPYVRFACLCDTHQKQTLNPKRRLWSKSSCDGPNMYSWLWRILRAFWDNGKK
jgi:hypothetical protein